LTHPKKKNILILLRKLLITVLHVSIILGIMKKKNGHQEADSGG
jgi:hypothetical protein